MLPGLPLRVRRSIVVLGDCRREVALELLRSPVLRGQEGVVELAAQELEVRADRLLQAIGPLVGPHRHAEAGRPAGSGARPGCQASGEVVERSDGRGAG